jgi:hypothetical protein
MRGPVCPRRGRNERFFPGRAAGPGTRDEPVRQGSPGPVGRDHDPGRQPGCASSGPSAPSRSWPRVPCRAPRAGRPVVWVDRDMDVRPWYAFRTGPGSPSVEAWCGAGRRRPSLRARSRTGTRPRSEDIPLASSSWHAGLLRPDRLGRVAALSGGHTGRPEAPSRAGSGPAARRAAPPGEHRPSRHYVGLGASPRGTTPAMDAARLNVLDSP